jgi:predicted phosphate transport protein (TIGR00153 family)
MSLTSILKLFQPKDRVFYGLFEKVVETNTLMGQKLKELVNTPDFNDRQVIINQIEALEHTNDENTHDIFTELGRNFITPFDREDIHALASALDDVADYIYSASKKINFYKVDPMEQGFQKMAEVIALSTETLHGAVMELRNMKNVSSITNALVKVNSLENQADDIYDMSIEKLFDTEPDAKEVIKKREIYQVMEIVTDKCEDAANVIESIIIKYA